MNRHAIIIGNGLAGPLLAVLLARDGSRVSLYERRADPRAIGYQGGRSINLALSARGLAGLSAAGLEQVVRERDIIPMPGRMMHARDGKLTFQPYSKNPDDAINSVSRGGLNRTLIESAADSGGVEMHFEHTCYDADVLTGTAVLRRPDGSHARVKGDLLIGADGAFSPIRGAMEKTDRFEYSQAYLGHGYKELHIPPTSGPTAWGRYAMDPGALHIWPRGGAMMIALPNRDGSFTCTLFWPFLGEHSFENLKTSSDIEAFFRDQYPDAVPLMPTLAADYLHNPVSSLVTVRCFPWHREGKTVLVGDAAHAIVPFYGQGINCGFEDCVELARCLREHADQREALDAYQSARKPNADAIADMALDNFTEMRDKVGRPEFLYRKRVEQAMHALFPDRWTPQYNLVSFSTVPYTEARRRGRELDAVLDRVIERISTAQAAGMSEEAWKTQVRAAVESAVETNAATAATEIKRSSSPPLFESGISNLRSEISNLKSEIANPAPPLAAPPLGPRSSTPTTLFDLTPRISPRLGVWPGDTPLSREVLCDLSKGDSVTLSTIRATVHLGAHADGPNHYDKDAPDISRRRLEHYLGPCHIIEARIGRGQRIAIRDLASPLESIRHPRILIKTGTFPNPESWNSDFAALSVELIDALGARGVITIGIDTPSVDLQDSKTLEAHNAILRHDISILEGLVLRDVAAGEYELIALPLPLEGFDASPVRAVLRPFHER